MFAIVPPGEAPSSTSPTASSGGSDHSSAIANASSGEISSRLVRPMAIPRGNTTTRRKSAGVSDSPSVTMITARASGRATSVMIESSTRAAH